jgi:hypothetical protein
MKEYLLNCGDFNIIVVPSRRQYFLLGDDEASVATTTAFVEGETIDYSALAPRWFRYAPDESWNSFDGSERQLNRDLQEDQLIDFFVLKKFNFGSLVAVRDGDKVQLFKRDRLGAT